MINNLTGNVKVWVEMPKRMEFAGDVMWAELIEDAEMHRPAREGMAWVRQLPTPAMPYAGEEGGWVTEQPKAKIDAFYAEVYGF
jgi:hypothetical protein